VRIAFFNTKPYDEDSFLAANTDHGHELVFFEARLTQRSAPLAAGFPTICAFVNDDLGATVLEQLAANGTRLVALRSAGFNNVDLQATADLDMRVVRVPAYSPYAVAEHAAGLVLTLNRRIHRAYARVREGNFSLVGLLGFDLHGKTVGVVGTGTIGTVFARIMTGFGCRVLAYDLYPNDECRRLGVEYVPRTDLFAASDIIALHCPLTPETHHLIDTDAIDQMRRGVMLINTSRGAIIDTTAVIDGLKSGRVGALGIDVYEEEEELFFQDLSDRVITDDTFMRLLTFPNVLVTGHQAFFTTEALDQIARTTLENITNVERAGGPVHEVTAERVSEARQTS
jgi:D-lactate dehydrogenase